MANIEVKVNPLELNKADKNIDWDASEFELYDLSGRALLQTADGEGAPPDSAIFRGLDAREGYQYRARVHDAVYGWGVWSEKCIVLPVQQPTILSPDIIAEVLNDTIHLTISELKTDTGIAETGDLEIRFLDLAGEIIQEAQIDDFEGGGEYTSESLASGDYVIWGRWIGDQYGDSDWWISETLTIPESEQESE